jgi:DNA (cytosine-5-)-methyltransferase|nr:MAG TPA: Cytosine specific methyltransferase [Caudoviricetes sp.]
MKFLDLFAGIGGFRLGMEAAGHECVGFCEIDKFARESYKAIHDTKGEIELHDITAVSDDTVRGIGHVDVICGGFPCQAFSIAGKRKGLEDARGTLFFEIARFASILRPRLLFLENVKGLLNHDGGDTFETIIAALDELGYDAEWQVLNSKNFGVPQNRERVFIIGHLRGASTRGVFPFGRESSKFDSEQPEIDIVGNTKSPNGSALGTSSVVYSPKGLIGTLCARDYKEPKQVAIPVLTPERPEKRQNGRRFKNDGEPMFTLTSQDKHGILIAGKLPANHDHQENNLVKIVDFYNKITKDEVGTLTSSGGGSTVRTGSFGVTDGYRIRKLTPRECWRLQGFPDWAFDKAQEVNSNSQLYKQAGNSVTVNVIEAIARELG